MGFAVFHAEKVTSNGSSLGDHIDRKPGQEHSYRSAAPELLKLNLPVQVTAHCSKPLKDAIQDRISEGYTGTTAIRKDAVKALSLVFTGTHEDMKSIEKDPQKMSAWLRSNFDFVAKEFGKENIVRFVLHRDEKTPHLHAVVVPLKEGRLSAKSVLGNRIDMSQRQDRYAQAMEPFGLSRGVKGSKAVHNYEGWYVGQIKHAQEDVLSPVVKFSMLDRINPTSFVENVTERLKSAQGTIKDADIKLKRQSQQLSVQAKHITIQEKEVTMLKDQVNTVKKQVNEVGKNLFVLAKALLGKPLSPAEQTIVDNHKKAYIKLEMEQKQAPKEEQTIKKNKGIRR